jgi:enoyl-CoA hydratase/carnithine racemase
MLGEMSLSERVTIEIVEGVAEVTLNRPDKLNALDPAMFEAIMAAGERLSRTVDLRAIVLTGAGKGFCAGLDKETFASFATKGAPAMGDITQRTHGIANIWQQVAYVWRTFPVPVIAAIHGVALGGGFQIALGADIRCVAPDARLAIMEIKWALVPDMSGIALMRELIARADVVRELTMTGRVFSGTEAFAYGFATSLHTDPLAAARSTAKEIAARNPDAVRAVKRLLNAASDSDAATILLAESKEQAALIGSPNQIEAVHAGMEGRPGRFADSG